MVKGGKYFAVFKTVPLRDSHYDDDLTDSNWLWDVGYSEKT